MIDERSPSTDASHADDPRQRLIAAAIACIERHGVAAVTTRLIAAQAGLNGAAVNYYFGGKQQLIARALEQTRREGFVEPLLDFDRVVAGGASPREALRSVLREMIQNSINFPKIAFAHLRDAVESQSYGGAAVVQLNEFLAKLEQRLDAGASPEQRRARRVRLAQIWSVVGMNAMAPGLFAEFTALDLKQDEHLDLFVDQLLAGLPLA